MSFQDAGAVLRPDVNTFVEEAARIDEMFIGTKALPIWPSDRRLGQYPKFRLAKAELLNDDVTLRAPGGNYGRVVRAYEPDTFTCVDRGLEEVVDDTYKEDLARFFDAEVVAAKQTLHQVMLGHEVRAAATIMDSTTFTATAAKVNYTETLLSTINFPFDVMAATQRLNAKGVIPNTIVMSNVLADQIKRSTLFQNYVRGNLPSGQPIIVQNSDIVRAFGDFGIAQVLIGKLSKNSAKKGQAFSATPVWGNTLIWIGYVAGGDPMAGGAGRTIVWNAEGGIFVTEAYREEQRRSNVIRVRQHTAEKVIDATSGELITTNYSAS